MPAPLRRSETLPSKLFTDWLTTGGTSTADVPIYCERDGGRAVGLAELKKLVADHFVGNETILKMGGYAKAATVIRNSVPTSKQTRSGDLGELLATEYVDAMTRYRVPVRKLCWKSDRQMPMHGNDVIAIDAKAKPVRLLKGESKSGKYVGKNVIEEASAGLDAHHGRPNPSTLAFITKRLYEENRDKEARVFERLQVDGALGTKSVEQLLFVLAGNDPCRHLAQAPKPKPAAIKRNVVGVVIEDHPEFIEAVFKSHGTKS